MTLALAVWSLEKAVSAPTKLYLNKIIYGILYMQQCSSRPCKTKGNTIHIKLLKQSEVCFQFFKINLKQKVFLFKRFVKAELIERNGYETRQIKFFVVCFCSFFGLDRAQNSDGGKKVTSAVKLF